MTRQAPEQCEVQGDVFDKDVAPTRCQRRDGVAVSVGELSPVYCCPDHARDMRTFWSPFFKVRAWSA